MSDKKIQVRKLLLELGVIFFGVTLAFFVENYREQINQKREFEQVLNGLIFELNDFSERGKVHQLAIQKNISAWKESYNSGSKTVPGYYRLPGSPKPPSSAWQSAISTGIAAELPPNLRYEIGYFYEEFIGIHVNYLRYTEITEKDIMPTEIKGAEFFYDEQGKLKPMAIALLSLIASQEQLLKKWMNWLK